MSSIYQHEGLLLLLAAFQLCGHSSHSIQKLESERPLEWLAFRNRQGLAHSVKVSEGSTESTSISVTTIDRVESEFGNLFICVKIDYIQRVRLGILAEFINYEVDEVGNLL